MPIRLMGSELSQSVGIMALRIENYASLVIEFERDYVTGLSVLLEASIRGISCDFE